MKTIAIGLILISGVLAASALEKAELDNRIRIMAAKFEMLQRQPSKGIPEERLRKAQAIVLLDRTKAGFLFAYQGGGGVALARDAKNGKWSPAAFLSANEGSLGFQVGGEQAFFVILLMNTNATRLLTEPSFDLGGEARGTAGDQSSGVEGKVASVEEPVIVYSDRKGLYGGVAVKAGTLAPDEEANRVYYGTYVTMKEILFDKKVIPTPAAEDLAAKLSVQTTSSKE